MNASCHCLACYFLVGLRKDQALQRLCCFVLVLDKLIETSDKSFKCTHGKLLVT